MKTALDLKKFDREEKLRMMEALWIDLSDDEAEMPSPGWHEKALETTEAKYTSGKASPQDWNSAKNDLRARFE